MLPPTFKHSVDVLLTLRLTSHLSHIVELSLFEQKRRIIFISFCALLEYYSFCVFTECWDPGQTNAENLHGSKITVKLCLANINNWIKAVSWMSAACKRRQWWHHEGWWWSVQSQKECNDTIWHLVQIDSRQIHKRQSLGRTEQTDRAGSWSAFSSIASGVGGDFATPPPLRGSFSGSSQAEVRRMLAVDRPAFRAPLCKLTPGLQFRGLQKEGQDAPSVWFWGAASNSDKESCKTREEEEGNGKALKKWICCSRFFISVLSS